MNYSIENGVFVISLEGRISSDNVQNIEAEVRDILEKNNNPGYLFDAERLEYISSAGLRFLLKLSKETTDKLIVRNVSSEVYDIFEMTGFSTFLDVKKKMREFSVEGCDVVGRGAMGTVYRLDEDTIIKVFDTVQDIPSIESEIRKTKDAFLLGIPTAIPFDIVKVGDKYGAVFELIKAKNFDDYLIENMDQLDDLCKKYADFIKSVHSVEAMDDNLPDIKSVYLEYLDEIKKYLPDDLYEKVLNRINSIPSANNIVHGDIQVKNIMVSSDEMILIDMDTLSRGNAVFEFAGLYMTYIAFNLHENNSKTFLGIDKDITSKLFYDTLKYYFDGVDEKIYDEKLTIIKILGLVRFLFLIAGIGIGLPELKDVRIKDSISELEAIA